MAEVRIVPVDDDGLARAQEAGHLFTTRAWTDALRESLAYEAFALDAVDDAGRIGRAIMLRARRGPFRLAGAPLPGSFIAHMDPRWDREDPAARAGAFAAWHAHLRASGHAYVEWRLREAASGALLAGLPYESVADGTYVVDLRPGEAALWDALDRKCRNMVRKAQKRGVQVEEVDPTGDAMARFQDLLRATFARHGARPPHPPAVLAALARHLHRAKGLTMLSARLSGRDLAMGIFCHDAREIYYVSGGSDADALEVGANNILQWEIIRRASAMGIGRYDMGGRGIASIDRFKESFGGAPHEHARLVHRTPAAAAAEKVARLGMRMGERVSVFTRRSA